MKNNTLWSITSLKGSAPSTALALLLFCNLVFSLVAPAPAVAQAEATCDSKFGGAMLGYWRYDNAADPMLPTYGSLRGQIVGDIPLSGGKIGQALTFNGDAYVDYGTDLDIPAWDQYTVAIWFLNDGRLPPQIGYGQKIIDKTTWFSDFFLGVQNSPEPVLPPQVVFMYDRDFKNIQSSGYNYVDGHWHHAVILRNGAHGELWIDGLLVGAKEDLQPTINDQPLVMGYSLAEDSYQQQYWGGLLDEFAVFNRALSAQEIMDLYQRSLDGQSYCTETSPFVVNSTADPGDGICNTHECTLRELIRVAMKRPEIKTITFQIPGVGPHLIKLNAPLEITVPLLINGYSQPGAQPNTNTTAQGLNTVLKIAIDGSITLRASSTLQGLAISGGIDVMQNRSSFYGNFIGTDSTGQAATNGGITLVSGGGNIQVGGREPGQRNLIVGRIYAGTDGTATVQGNLMGTDNSGTRALGPGTVVGQNATLSIGGDDPSARNLLTSVSLGEASADIRGNYIGVDVTGTQPLGNGGSIQSGFGAGFTAANNLIAYTGGTPIIIGNSGRVSGNRIFSNGGLGIDVGNDGVSLNDLGDLNSTGRGGKQNFPIINWARRENGATVVEGIFDSRPATNYTLEFFANTTCDPSGFGEGERVFGTTTLTTDAAGKATFRTSFPLATATGEFVTALATGPGNSSEFGPCQVMGASGVNRFLLPKGLKGAYDPTPVTNAPAGVYTLSATFTNRASRPLAQLYYRIILLTGKNLVLNAHGGPAGVGGVVKGPTLLAPGASFTIDFVIGLQQKMPFLFLPSAFGLTDDVVATEVDMTGVSYSVTAEELGVSEVKQIYLPLVVQ